MAPGPELTFPLDTKPRQVVHALAAMAGRARSAAAATLFAWVALVAPAVGQDFSYNILPPGQYGNLPTTVHSTDQLPLYDSLTPLRGNVSVDDIERLYKPEDFEPNGPTTVVETGRPGSDDSPRLLRGALHLRHDERRRLVRGRIRHGSGPRAAAVAGQGYGTCDRGRHPGCRPAHAADQRELVRPERTDRGPRHGAAGEAGAGLRQQGTPDPARSRGLR